MVESEEELSSEFQNSNFMSKDSGLVLSETEQEEGDPNIDYDVST